MLSLSKPVVAVVVSSVAVFALSGCAGGESVEGVSGSPASSPSVSETSGGEDVLLVVPSPPNVDAGEASDNVGDVQSEVVDVVVGESVELVQMSAQEAGWAVRVVSIDGEEFPVTADYSPSRMNLVVVGGVVEGVTLG